MSCLVYGAAHRIYWPDIQVLDIHCSLFLDQLFNK